MKNESIIVWLSYSSPEHPLVKQICHSLKSPKVDDVAKSAFDQLSKISEQKVSHARIVPKGYRLDFEGGEAVYRLAPSRSINQLIFDIANTPLRIMLLSPSYFASEDCLNELCLSLCSNYNIPPMLILVGFDNLAAVFDDGEFAFFDSENPANSKPQTLLQALTARHQALSNKLENWRGFDLSNAFRDKLPDLLADYKKLLFVPVSEQDRLHDVNKADNAKADDAKPVAVAIYRYFFSFLSAIDMGSHHRLVAKLYRDWCEYDFAKKLLVALENRANFQSFDHINTADQAATYLHDVRDFLAKNKQWLVMEQSQQLIYRLYGLLMLKCLNLIGANLLQALGNEASLIDVNVNNDTQIGLQNSVHATLSFCSVTGFAPQMDEQASAKNIDDHQLQGCVFARKQTVLGDSDGELYDALKALGAYLAPHDKTPGYDELTDITSDAHSDYIECIRDGLIAMKNWAKQGKSGRYGLLVLSDSLLRSTDGYFTLLKRLEHIINKDYPDEKLFVPCVVLRAEQQMDGFKTELLLPHAAFRQFRRQFQELAALYQSTQANTTQANTTQANTIQP